MKKLQLTEKEIPETTYIKKRKFYTGEKVQLNVPDQIYDGTILLKGHKTTGKVKSFLRNPDGNLVAVLIEQPTGKLLQVGAYLFDQLGSLKKISHECD